MVSVETNMFFVGLQYILFEQLQVQYAYFIFFSGTKLGLRLVGKNFYDWVENMPASRKSESKKNKKKSNLKHIFSSRLTCMN